MFWKKLREELIEKFGEKSVSIRDKLVWMFSLLNEYF